MYDITQRNNLIYNSQKFIWLINISCFVNLKGGKGLDYYYEGMVERQL